MEAIKKKLIKTDEPAFFHDSRGDVRKLAKMVNLLIDKVNELVAENNKLNERISRLNNQITTPK